MRDRRRRHQCPGGCSRQHEPVATAIRNDEPMLAAQHSARSARHLRWNPQSHYRRPGGGRRSRAPTTAAAELAGTAAVLPRNFTPPTEKGWSGLRGSNPSDWLGKPLGRTCLGLIFTVFLTNPRSEKYRKTPKTPLMDATLRRDLRRNVSHWLCA